MDGEDLLIEILLWLPVVSLLRSKAVCKLWRSIIESSDFIHRHATFQGSTSKLGNFIFQYRPSHITSRNFKPHFFLLSSSRDSEEDYGRWIYRNLGMSPHLSDDEACEDPMLRQANMVGSCHGIICMHDPEPRHIILWNPATKKFRCLPKSLPLLGVILSEFVLFGFDCETYDYKVLQITFFEIGNEVDITPPSRIQIYSLLTDSWRWCIDANLYGHSHKFNTENQGRYLNGSFYFSGNHFHREEIIRNSALISYGDRIQEAVVLSFNFSTESFRMIPGPCDNFSLDVTGSGDQGKIVCVAPSSNGIIDVYEVYALNDYDYSCRADNNDYSWSKLHTLGLHAPYADIGYRLKAIPKNGVFGFIRGINSGMVFINFLTEEMKDIEIIDASLEGVGVIFRGDVYKESLVSI